MQAFRPSDVASAAAEIEKETVGATAPPTEKPKKPKSKSKISPKPSNREVIYPQVKVEIRRGDKALTAEDAKRLLCWDDGQFDGPGLLEDESGQKVLCRNNTRNRPFDERHARRIAQNILTKEWKFNGEAIIIGSTGEVLSAQHRLIGLVLAAQKWAGPEKDHWTKYWQKEPVLESVVVYGVDETDETVRTLDNVRERTLADILFTQGDLVKVKGEGRKAVVKVLANAVDFLWFRTGGKWDAFCPYKTHTWSLDFLERHPSLVKCAKEIYDYNEKSEGGIKAVCPLGVASGLCYLFAAGGSSLEKYKKNPKEKSCDLSRMQKALEFFQLLAEGIPAVTQAIAWVRGEDGEGYISLPERLWIIGKAFDLYLEGKKIRLDSVKPKYEVTEDLQDEVLVSIAHFGGIDNPEKPEAPKAEKPAPTEEAGEAGKEAAKSANARKAKPSVNGQEVDGTEDDLEDAENDELEDLTD